MIYFTNETGSCKTTVQFGQKVHGWTLHMIMCVLLCYPVSIRIYYQQGGRFLVFDFDSTNLKRLELKKKELENIRKDKLNGIMIRSRAQWLSEGEKPSKYFCSLEKFYYTKKQLKEL